MDFLPGPMFSVLREVCIPGVQRMFPPFPLAHCGLEDLNWCEEGVDMEGEQDTLPGWQPPPGVSAGNVLTCSALCYLGSW